MNAQILRGLFLAMFGALVLTGCMTAAPHDTAFAPNSANSLLVIAGPPAGMAYYVKFRRVDLETSQFGEQIVTVTTAGIGGMNQLNSGSHAGFALAAEEVAPGDYAIVELGMNTFNGYASGQTWLCTDRAAPIYTLSAGRIQIIRTDHIFSARSQYTQGQYATSDDVILQEFESSRARYTSLAGTASVLQPTEMINWPRKTPNLWESRNRNCAEPPLFTRRTGAETEITAPSGK